MERHEHVRKAFEAKIKTGTYSYGYNLFRCHGGEYLSYYTEAAWRMYLSGWLEAVERYCR